MNKTVRISFGIIQIVLSIYWIYHTVELYFLYQNSELLFAFRLPVWVFFIEIILSLLNVIFGINLIQNKINIIKNRKWENKRKKNLLRNTKKEKQIKNMRWLKRENNH